MDALELSRLIEGEEPSKPQVAPPPAAIPAAVPPSRDSLARKLAVMPKPKPVKKEDRRRRGTGHMFVRGGFWWMEFTHEGHRVRESLRVPATGKKVDQHEAERRMDEAVRRIRSGEAPKKFEPVTVQEMFDIWIAEVERTAKASTAADYRRRWTAHLQATFGKMLAHNGTVTKDIVSAYLADRKHEGAGEITQNRENRVLQMIFKYNRSKIPANLYPEFPKMHNEESHVRRGKMSKTDYESLQAKLSDPSLFWLRAMLALAFTYGFRTKSELVPATVSYFNPSTSTFTVPPYSTKNRMERSVKIVRDGEIYKMLVELTAGRTGDAPLFHRNGKAVKDFRGTWEKLTAGMTGGSGKGGSITIHDLRRSAISAMANKGINAKQAGTHLRPEIFNRYVVLSDAEQEKNAAIIES